MRSSPWASSRDGNALSYRRRRLCTIASNTRNSGHESRHPSSARRSLQPCSSGSDASGRSSGRSQASHALAPPNGGGLPVWNPFRLCCTRCVPSRPGSRAEPKLLERNRRDRGRTDGIPSCRVDRARDQFLGAAIGGITGFGAFLALDQSPIAYPLAVVIAMLICWTLNMATASRLAGITATIILLVPRAGMRERMVLSRVAEVGCGVCAAVGTVWVAARFLRFPRSQH